MTKEMTAAEVRRFAGSTLKEKMKKFVPDDIQCLRRIGAGEKAECFSTGTAL
jgi:hypothetical protein